MRLQRLTGLEREQDRGRVQRDHRSSSRSCAPSSPARTMVVDIIARRDDGAARQVRRRAPHADRRRDAGDFEVEDLIADEDMVITISHSGYIKRMPATTYRRQRRGGRGIAGFGGQEEDFVEHIFVASTHSYLLFFSNRGGCYWVKVHELPQAGRTARGKAIVNLLAAVAAGAHHEHRAGEATSAEPGTYLVMATRKGVIKRCDLSDFSNPRRGGIIAIGLREGDSLVGVALTRGTSEIVLAKRAGKAVRFKETDVRSMGRAATGVRGAELEGDDDEVIGMVDGDAAGRRDPGRHRERLRQAHAGRRLSA